MNERQVFVETTKNIKTKMAMANVTMRALELRLFVTQVNMPDDVKQTILSLKTI